jgi:hypothetical protein
MQIEGNWLVPQWLWIQDLNKMWAIINKFNLSFVPLFILYREQCENMLIA